MGRYEEVLERTKGFMHDRFGMFIHFGIYAVAARGEWVKSRETMTDETYQKYFDNFTIENFDAKEWAKVAKKAGMKYAVLTTKHHDGFCLFDSQYTDYKSTNTPCGRDIVREFADAFHAEGIKVGFYYSLLDWHHPDYPHEKDSRHPMRGNPAYSDENRDFSRYTEYMRNQVRELLTNYGRVDLMWFDSSYDKLVGEVWEATKLVTMMRELQPHIVIDNRLDSPSKPNKNLDLMPVYGGDFFSPEQTVPTKPMCDELGRLVPWEECLTTDPKSWGYDSTGNIFMTAKDIIRTLVDCVSKGGNLLLNVGPNGKGEFPKKLCKVFEEVGEWMYENGDSIYGCGISDLPQPYNGRVTQNGKDIYLHFFERSGFYIHVEGIMTRDVDYCINIEDNSEVIFKPVGWSALDKDMLILQLKDAELPNPIDTVIKVVMKDKKAE